MGDYLDLVSSTERPIANNRGFHNSTLEYLEDKYKDSLDAFYEEISFMRGRIIGLINGNHYVELQAGINGDQYLCEKLHCKYLGVSSFIRLCLRYDRDHTHQVDMWVHHGLGGATLGANINSIQKMEQVGRADIYLMGHNHHKSVNFKSILSLTDSRNEMHLKETKILLGRTGSFLKGYERDKRSYIADSGMPPTDLGVIKIEITPKRKTINGIDIREIDIHASI